MGSESNSQLSEVSDGDLEDCANLSGEKQSLSSESSVLPKRSQLKQTTIGFGNVSNSQSFLELAPPLPKSWEKELYPFFEKTAEATRNKNVYVSMKCKLCSTGITDKSSWNFKRHLKSNHKNEFELLSKGSHLKPPLVQTANKTSSSEEPKKSGSVHLNEKYSATHLKQVAFENAIQDLVVLDGVPFDIVKGVGFKNLVRVLDPRVTVPHPTTVARRLDKSYENYLHRRKVLLRDQGTGCLHFIVDIWTSRQMEATMGVKVQFIDRNWDLKQFVLGFKHFPGKHTGENIRKMLEDFLYREYHLRPNQVGTVTADNAANMIAAFKVMDSSADVGPLPDAEADAMEEFVHDEDATTNFFEEISTILEHSALHRNGCLCHLLQLAVKDAQRSVSEVPRLTKKVNDIVSFFGKSANWKDVLRRETEGLNLIRPTDVRWNSTFKCFKRILHKGGKASVLDAVNKVITEAKEQQKNSNSKARVPTEIQYREKLILEKLCELLEPLADLTDDLQGDNVTSSLPIIGVMNALNEILAVTIDEDEDTSNTLQDFKNSLVDSLCTRFTGVSALNPNKIRSIVKIDLFHNKCYILATFLDPRMRLLPFEGVLSKNSYLQDKVPSVDEVRAVVKEAYEEELNFEQEQTSSVIEDTDTLASTGPLAVSSGQSDDHPLKKKRKLLEILSSVAAEKAKFSSGATFQEEYDKYLNFAIPTNLENVSPLDFWKKNADHFPRLSTMARKYLSMPASSGSVERLFSLAGALKTVKRSGLKIDTVEKLLYLRDDLRTKFGSDTSI